MVSCFLESARSDASGVPGLPILIRRSVVPAVTSGGPRQLQRQAALGVVMRSPLRRAACAAGVVTVLIGLAVGARALPVFAATVPPAPEDLELHAGADTSITLEWAASPGA